MQTSPYDVFGSEDALTFEFDSVSPTRIIRKLVAYDQFPDNPLVWNLSLGDIQQDGSVDDLSRSDNGDLDKVMATVLHTLFLFFERYPECAVFFKGSTKARTRLYQIILSKELEYAKQWFVISGFTGHTFEPFVTNKAYKAFLVSLKN